MILRCLIVNIFILVALNTSVICLCRYRGGTTFPPKVFSYWASAGCYIYTRPDLFEKKLAVLYGNVTDDGAVYEKTPGILISGQYVPFDYHNEVIVVEVKKSFRKSETAENWISCSKSAESCCENVMMNQPGVQPDICPSVWDGWSCFNQTPANTKYQQLCSKYAYASDPPRCLHFSTKDCLANATWTDQTDYSACSVAPRLILRTQWHIAALTISIVICTPGVLVLILYNSFQQQKFILLRNLIIAIILRNLFVLISKSYVIMDELVASITATIMQRNAWPCKTLAFFERFFANAVFTCMLLEAIFLHRLVTNVFGARQHPGGPKMRIYYVLGAVISLVTAVSWSISMALHGDENCWTVTEGTDFHWINDFPRLIMLIANFFLLMHIVVVLWRTFHNREDEHHAILRTTKTLLICLPLFGIPFFFVIVHPDTDSCYLEQAYYFIYYTIEALQGILIVILNCYTERDVKRKFNHFYKKVKGSTCEIYQNRRRNNRLTNRTIARRETFNTSLEAEGNSVARTTCTTPLNKRNRSGRFSSDFVTSSLSSPGSPTITNPFCSREILNELNEGNMNSAELLDSDGQRCLANEYRDSDSSKKHLNEFSYEGHAEKNSTEQVDPKIVI